MKLKNIALSIIGIFAITTALSQNAEIWRLSTNNYYLTWGIANAKKSIQYQIQLDVCRNDSSVMAKKLNQSESLNMIYSSVVKKQTESIKAKSDSIYGSDEKKGLFKKRKKGLVEQLKKSEKQTNMLKSVSIVESAIILLGVLLLQIK